MEDRTPEGADILAKATLPFPVPPVPVTSQDGSPVTATALAEAAHYAVTATALRNRLARLMRQRAALVPYIEEVPGTIDDLSIEIEDTRLQLRQMVEFCGHKVLYTEADYYTEAVHKICVACGKVVSDSLLKEEFLQGFLGPGTAAPTVTVTEDPPRRNAIRRDLFTLRRTRSAEASAAKEAAKARREEAKIEIEIQKSRRARIRSRVTEKQKAVKARRDNDRAMRQERERKDATNIAFARAQEKGKLLAELRWSAHHLPVASLIRQLDLTELPRMVLHELTHGLSLEIKRRQRGYAPGDLDAYRFGTDAQLEKSALQCQRAWEKFTGRYWDPEQDDFKGDKKCTEEDIRAVVVKQLEIQKGVPDDGTGRNTRAYPGWYDNDSLRPVCRDDFTDSLAADVYFEGLAASPGSRRKDSGNAK